MFVDAEFLSTDDLQYFSKLLRTANGFLATYTVDGISAAEMIKGAATEWQINSVLLVKLKSKRASSLNMKSRHNTESTGRWVWIPDDDPSCSGAPRGLRGQIDCAARVFRAYLTELQQGRQPYWRVDHQRASTLNLYAHEMRRRLHSTPIPWVLTRRAAIGSFGMSFNVLHDHCSSKPNHRFIMGLCLRRRLPVRRRDLCGSTVSRRKRASLQPCERTCPDRKQPHTAITFCGATDEGGFCYARVAPKQT